MTTLTKVLIGAAAVTTVAVVVTVVKKNNEKKNESTEEQTEEKKEGLIQRLKDYVLKKVIRILGWTAIHMEQIEAAATIISLVATVASIVGAVKDMVKGNDLNAKLDEIDEKLSRQERYYRDEFRALYDDHNILAHNQAKIAKAVGVPTKE